jgi:hypothetical protein
MIDTQQQYIKLNIRGEISIIVMNKFERFVFNETHLQKRFFSKIEELRN